MKQPVRKTLFFVLTMTLLAAGCKKEETTVAPTSDNEALTTAVLSLTNAASVQDVVTASVENLNTQASFANASLRLKANTTYLGAIQLFDKTRTPAIEVTRLMNKNEHLFVYTPSATGLLSVTITDKDTNPAPGPYPVGLQFTLKTGPAATGSLRVQLRHQPNAKNGTATPGTDDLRTDFPVMIQ